MCSARSPCSRRAARPGSVRRSSRRPPTRSIATTRAGRGYREDDELGGSDPYSASKSCVELMTRSYRESFLRDGAMLIASVRAGNVIGGGDWAEDRLLPDIDARGVRRRAAADPQPQLDAAVAACARSARRLSRGRRPAARPATERCAMPGTSGPPPQAHIRVARHRSRRSAAALPELKVEYEPDAERPPRIRPCSSSIPRRRWTRLGWRPRWESEMLERTIEWYRAYYEEGRLISDQQLDAYKRRRLSRWSSLPTAIAGAFADPPRRPRPTRAAASSANYCARAFAERGPSNTIACR